MSSCQLMNNTVGMCTKSLVALRQAVYCVCYQDVLGLVLLYILSVECLQQTPVIIKQEVKQKSKKQSDQKAGANKQTTGAAVAPSQILQACEQLWTSEDVDGTCAQISQSLKQVLVLNSNEQMLVSPVG